MEACLSAAAAAAPDPSEARKMRRHSRAKRGLHFFLGIYCYSGIEIQL